MEESGKGFLKYTRQVMATRPISERIHDHFEMHIRYTAQQLHQQASRCMNCGTPFCESGCPAGSDISEWVTLTSQGKFREAFESLQSTINFPEFTSRLCGGFCESACVLGINQPPVSIANIEQHIIEIAFEKGWVKPFIPATRTGKGIAIIGSGPAGLAAADQLNRAGHSVSIFERQDRPGGILRYGIPDCRLEKWVLERRISLLQESGITFYCSAYVGSNIAINDLLKEYEAIILAGGCTVPRDLSLPGRHLKGIYSVMELLEYANRYVSGDHIPLEKQIDVSGKNIVVISGKTGGWLGVLTRLGARNITTFELLPKPPIARTAYSPWPLHPLILRTSAFDEEGGERHWGIAAKSFLGNNMNCVQAIKICDFEWRSSSDGQPIQFIEISGTEREFPADIVILSLGFVHPQHQGLLTELGVELDERGNVKASAKEFKTNIARVFAAGDMRRGQSEIIWAISEGRECARKVDEYLMGTSTLESKDLSIFLADK